MKKKRNKEENKIKIDVKKIREMLYEVEDLNNEVYDYIENNIEDKNPLKETLHSLVKAVEDTLYSDYAEIDKEEEDKTIEAEKLKEKLIRNIASIEGSQKDIKTKAINIMKELTEFKYELLKESLSSEEKKLLKMVDELSYKLFKKYV